MSRDILLKKLYYLSNYRGCKETDLLLGNFAKTYLTQLSDAQLTDYEYLLNQADVDIYHGLMHAKEAKANLQELSIWELLVEHSSKV
jgi:antitoxin CptB